MRPRGAIDWDGTCVENVWPEQGDWMPDAVATLTYICTFADLVIHTCRIAPVEFQAEHIERAPALVQAEKNAIRKKLDDAGLYEIGIHDKPWKPSADFYLDDKGMHFPGTRGAWKAVGTKLAIKYAPETLTD